MTVKYHWLSVFCDVIGWIYFVAWSISFYPQTILNYRRKCVAGMSFDYMALYNFTGFLFYSIYCIAIFIHKDGTSNPSNPIAINDIAFTTHAFLLTSVKCIQILIYDRAGQKPSMFAMWLTSVLWIVSLYNVSLSIAFNGDLPWFGRMSTIAFLGYMKVLITTVKYIPQAYMNYTAKSTLGWSIHNILLDFTGGSLSVLQQCLIAYNTNDWGFITHNIPKFMLGVESMLFDVVFIVQHYVLYGSVEVESRMSKKSVDAAVQGEAGNIGQKASLISNVCSVNSIDIDQFVDGSKVKNVEINGDASVNSDTPYSVLNGKMLNFYGNK